jgi:magnesium chelatase subunit D
MAQSAASPTRTAALIAAILAIDPMGLGGVRIKSGPSPARDSWLVMLRQLIGLDRPWRRLPAGIAESRLLGGLDLAATLSAGQPVAERGLLSEVDGGMLVIAMAERAEASTIAHITTALDHGSLRIERDGIGMMVPARLCAIALDESLDGEEPLATRLCDRLAFDLDLSLVGFAETFETLFDGDAIARARDLYPLVILDDQLIESLCAAALSLGIDSSRACLQAIRAVRAIAALGGRDKAIETDAALAAELILAPRTKTLPPPEMSESEQEETGKPPPDHIAKNNDDTDQQNDPAQSNLEDLDLTDIILDAVRAALPAGLLAQINQTGSIAARQASGGRKGQMRKSKNRGRPIGTRAGALDYGAKLNVIETLRAAAPWQVLRRAARPSAQEPRRLEIRTQDFRLNRFKQRAETATIFVVDASGSSALNRMAEAKGAVELLLADCYARRDTVALIAFRGPGAELLLPPTRSLVRAKRSLAGLPGGGGTPLASSIDMARELAIAIRRKGQSPAVIFMTDGRANIARDGKQDRATALMDAADAARLLRLEDVRALLIDTSPRPQAEGQKIASEMGARYVPLPYADAAKLAQVTRQSLADVTAVAA